MNQEQLDILAIKVMKWIKGVDDTNIPKKCQLKRWINKEGKFQVYYLDWQPHKNLNQAFQLLDAYCEKYKLDWWVGRDSHTLWHEFWIQSPKNKKILETKCLASEICKAIYERVK